MRPILHLALLLVAMAAPARAGSGPAPALSVLKGRYGFNWFGDPSQARCVRIGDPLLKEFAANYHCDLVEQTASASGQPQVTCTRKDKSREYLIFKTRALCEQERETQQANGD